MDLYPEEVQIIELNDFGGSRGMVRELPPEDRDMQKPCKKGQIILGSNSAKRRKVDASRARLLIQNFVFIRIISSINVSLPRGMRVSHVSRKHTAKGFGRQLTRVGDYLVHGIARVQQEVTRHHTEFRRAIC